MKQSCNLLVVFIFLQITSLCLKAASDMNFSGQGLCRCLKNKTKNVEAFLYLVRATDGTVKTIELGQKWQPTFWAKLVDEEEMAHRCQAVRDFCKTHTFEIVAGVLLASYIWIAYQIQRTKTLLKNPTAWCNWQSNMSLSDLKLQSEQDLCKKLKADLTIKYSKRFKNTSTSIKRPIYDYIDFFMQDINRELGQLYAYEQWCTRTDTICCNVLFDFVYDLKMIQEKQKKLLFILNLCKIWCFN